MGELIVGLTIFGNVILPLILLYWMTFNKSESIVQKIAVSVTAISFIFFLWLMGPATAWLGSAFAILLNILCLPALYRIIKSAMGLPWLPKRKFLPWLQFSLTFLFGLTNVSVFPDFFGVKDYEEKAIELDFPLRSGTYHILHGGSSFSVNHHYKIKAQKYALDLVKINDWGIRANGIMPEDLKKYASFGEKLYAPCSGEVLATENNRKDYTPPNGDPDLEKLLGNYVIIFCNGSSVVLAHMVEGSVLVSKGDIVKAGDELGKLGNSGNTSEPHLHIHAVEGKHTDKNEIAFKANGVPMTFDSRYLIRNDRVIK